MTPLAIFGISNDGLNLAVKLVVLFLVAIWAALVFWTYADARRRIEDPMLVGCAAAASFFFPFVGSIVYAIVRPPEYLEDVHERELEIAAAEARLHQVEGMRCPHCDFEIEKGFLRCPSCLRRLKEPCGTCGRPLDPRWKICPYCEAEVGAAPSQARRRPRRSTPAAAGAPPDRQREPRASSSARPQDPGGQTVEHPAPTRPQSR
jgi:hypothetical protein